MREIKFRTWNPEYTSMMYEDDVATINDIINMGREFDTLMQFTGLLDKNGREIYEGDIIRTHYGYPDKEEYEGVVEDIRTDCNFESDAVMEVIGNIYENPELLSY